MKYEIMFIIRPDLEEKVIREVAQSFEKTLIDNNAKITFAKEAGQKQLAYEIKKHKSGYYFVCEIIANDDKAINEFDRLALLSENVIRHMIIKIEE